MSRVATPEGIVRAVLVEDDEDQREAVVLTLRGMGLSVDGVGSVADFYRKLLVQRYDVAIIDLGLPDGDGRSIVRFVAEQTSMGIIILSAAGDVEERIRGFGTGADLYFVKPVDCRELASAVVRLARRLVEVRPPVPTPSSMNRVTRDDNGIGFTSGGSESWILIPSNWRLVSPKGGEVMLTPKEMLFMRALARQPGEVVLRSTLIQHLRYPDDVGGNRRLEAIVRRLRLKAEQELGHGIPISTVHGIGYVFSQPIMMAALGS